jgi:hypothetical protein
VQITWLQLPLLSRAWLQVRVCLHSFGSPEAAFLEWPHLHLLQTLRGQLLSTFASFTWQQRAESCFLHAFLHAMATKRATQRFHQFALLDCWCLSKVYYSPCRCSTTAHMHSTTFLRTFNYSFDAPDQGNLPSFTPILMTRLHMHSSHIVRVLLVLRIDIILIGSTTNNHLKSHHIALE